MNSKIDVFSISAWDVFLRIFFSVLKVSERGISFCEY